MLKVSVGLYVTFSSLVGRQDGESASATSEAKSGLELECR